MENYSNIVEWFSFFSICTMSFRQCSDTLTLWLGDRKGIWPGVGFVDGDDLTGTLHVL